MTEPNKNRPLPESVRQHRAEAPETVVCAVVTVSDTRTEADDKSGALIREKLGEAGHEAALYRIVPDDPERVRAAIEEARQSEAVRAVLLTGGTGIGRRDGTAEVVASLVEKRLDGFGELFRMLSYEEIGAAAMLSRALAGTYAGMIVFAMPGSSAAVRLAMEKLILPELGHLLREVQR